MMNEKTMVLFQDQEFLKRVLVLEPEEAQKEFEQAGGTITVEELKEIGEKINRAVQNGGELDEASLEDVSGGGVSWGVVKFAIGVGIGIGITCASW